MEGVEILIGIIIGICILMTVISIITHIVVKISNKHISKMKNVYWGKLTNTDASIHEAIKYIKLTNSIMEKGDGEESK